MKTHRPDHDLISAYLDGELSEDSIRSMEQHLRRCDRCRVAVEKERRFLFGLDGLATIDPGPTFVEAVMGRVAQYPSYRSATSLPWRLVAAWVVTLSALLLVVATLTGWGLLRSDAVVLPDGHALAKVGVTRLADLVLGAVKLVRQALAPGYVLAETAGELVLRLSAVAATSGWVFQITLLVLTVMLNYAFTRLILNYQRQV